MLLSILGRKNKKIKFIYNNRSDNLKSFHKWKNYEIIIDFCQLVVFFRKGYDKMAKKICYNESLKNKKMLFIRNKKINISSKL